MRIKLTLVLLSIFLQLVLSGHALFAQSSKTDSTNVASKSVKIVEEKRLNGDSIQNALYKRTDILHVIHDNKTRKLDSVRDRIGILKRSNDPVDSIQDSFNQRSDSLQRSYKIKLNKLSSQQLFLQKEIDSLTTFKLSSGRLIKSLDSLNSLREKTTVDFEKKMQSIKEQATSKLKELDLPPEAQEKLNTVSQKINSVRLPASDVKISSLNNPTNSLVKDVPGISTNNPLESQSLTKKLGGTGLPDKVGNQLPMEKGNVPGVANISGKVGEYSKDARELASGNMNKVKNLPKTAEEKAVDFSGVKKLEEQTKSLDQYKDITGKVKDQEALKKELKEKAKKAAVNHFAGKEEQLKAAMEKMSKYKQKYSSMNGLHDLSNKRRNEMRDKPLIERIVPGIALQIQKRGEDLLVDFNPYAGYKFTNRISAGLGWNQRVGYNTNHYSFSPNARIYGPRVFSEFKLGKGFSPRAEFEVMNTNVPPLTPAIDPEHREWVHGAFAGMKKEYKLFKSVKGTAMVMARLYNPNHKSPYADVLNVRFGFEFPMKKKLKK